MFFNRLSKRYRHLKKWARRTETNAFRLYDRDIPEIPLVLDLYNDAVSGALYKRPNEKDEAEFDHQSAEAWLSVMKAAASKALDIPEKRIFIKERRRMRHRHEDGAQYDRISRQNYYRDVSEAGLLFRVNLSDYLDTGLFLDARKKRALIRSLAGGKRVLNLFAYTCSLSVAAAKGGAALVDSVDLSGTYLEWGRINFALNGLEAVYSDSIRHSEMFALIRSDVYDFFEQAAAGKSRWDIIILDPPVFSNSKRMKSAMDLARDHRDLISRSLSLLSPEGTLWFSSSARGVKIEAGDFPGLAVKDFSKELTDEDFRGKKVPSCYAITRHHVTPHVVTLQN